ncbi:GL13313 [Drosophila persimilis]|uniref:GL13313 n=1 Tax=Drosophila persimilis TaxID=7234 RepID=B4HCM7_DROPE|nr:GL13313 [Drosophila persimilis]
MLRMVTRRQDDKLKAVSENVNRVRRTAKGDRLLELTGECSSSNERMKEDIQLAMGNQVGIRAVSEESCVEIRDLDTLVTKEDVVAAIAKQAGQEVVTSAVKSLRQAFAGTQMAIVCRRSPRNFSKRAG